jgi:Flp pilus assembly protein TadB
MPALTTRIRPFSHLSRSRLGRGADVSAISVLGEAPTGSVPGRVFAPMALGLAGSLSGLIDMGGDDVLARRLRHAGMDDMTPEHYRMRQLAWTVGAGAAGISLGMLRGSTTMALLMGAAGCAWGATIVRGRVNRAIRDRTTTMRAELYTVAQLIAMYVRAGRGSVQAVQAVCDRGTGPVIAELREALSWMAGGLGQADAYDRLADDTAEPAASRLYRLLADSIRSGGDLGGALLTISDDLRAERREDLERQAVKRRGAMLVPTIAVMAPVVLLWVVAPVPQMVLGLGK